MERGAGKCTECAYNTGRCENCMFREDSDACPEEGRRHGV